LIKKKAFEKLALNWIMLFDIPTILYLHQKINYILRIIGRMWCHCRMVYLPMCYLYGKRFVGPITPTILSLRKELFTVPYHDVDWNQARNLCAKVSETA